MTKVNWKQTIVGLAFAAVAVLASGCVTDGDGGDGKPPRYTGQDESGPAPDFNAFQIDDQVQVIFSGSSQPPDNHGERVNDDGTITLPLIGSVKAAGLTPKELEESIQRLYVPQYYKRLGVSVQREHRYFWVSGEVRQPSIQNYLGETTVLRAIAAAGHFTDFADVKNVKLTRKSGKQWLIDAKAAQKNAKYDPPVYPGDRIHVPKRFY